MKITMSQVKRLREKTGAGVMDVKRAIDEARSSVKVKVKSEKIMRMAEEIIKKKGLSKAKKKAGRKTGEGLIFSYVHHNGRSGAMVELACETDFVARNDDFRNLAKELAMQVTSMNPRNVAEFLVQDYIRNPKMRINDLVAEAVGKIGENIRLVRFVRYGLGEGA